ncbi:MAG: glycosyltransferase [Christensenellales bacterium]
MKKITFLMLHLNYGGIEKQVTTLANELLKEYEVEIISLYDILSGESFYQLDDKVKVKYIFNFGPNKDKIKDALKKFKLITLIKQLCKAVKILYTKYFGLGKIIKDLNTDILISSRIEFSKQIKRNDIITISQEHSFIDNEKYIKKVRKSFKHIKYLIVMTKGAKEKYDEWLKNEKIKPEVIVIPNIIKENKSGKISNLNNRQIISVGRLEDVKDFYTLILVFSVIVKKYPNYILKIIGEGSMREKLEEQIKKCNLQKNVILTGRRTENEINNELIKSDVFVLTSKSESFSLVLCEAMNFGVPCIAFDVDVGPREIIQDGKNGFLIENRNVDLMIERLDELLYNISLRRFLGSNSYNVAKNYYSENIINKWKNIFGGN